MLVRSGSGKANFTDEKILVDFAMCYGKHVRKKLDEGPFSVVVDSEQQSCFRF